ncbi:transketolase, partial [Candidatus Pelagibacter sp.]|nr:transketolase [Candidatus Pelagibacter sp.]
MIEINKNKIKIWSTIGQRATFGMVVYEIANKIKDLTVLTCDVSTSAGLDRFRKNFADKFVELGISEQNMIGIAAALANEKHKVITTSFAPFQTMRCCEQIKVNLGYMKQKITMVGLASGLVLGPLGYTHCCIEDVGVLRSIPNLTIISPADGLELGKALIASLNHNQSTYIRITGSSNTPIIYDMDYNFEIGKPVTLKEGKDITIFATGSMVKVALVIADELQKIEILATVINIHTIKPFEDSIVKKHIKSKLFVSIEEHNTIGGLGSAVSEATSKIGNGPKHIFCGVDDNYQHHGNYEHLLENYNLT